MIVADDAVLFTATGCARGPNTVDWQQRTRSDDLGLQTNRALVAFATSNRLALFQTANISDVNVDVAKGAAKILSSTHCHEKDVTCVRFIGCPSTSAEANLLITGSVDTTAKLWRVHSDRYTLEKVCSLDGHSGTVHYTCGLIDSRNPTRCVCATASVDSKLIIWSVDLVNENVDKTQQLEYPGFALAVDFLQIPTGWILAVGCDDNMIKIYSRSIDNQPFVLSQTLSGHTNCIRGVVFQNNYLEHDDAVFYLASCSQDTYVRIWKFTAERTDDAVPSETDELRLKSKTFGVGDGDGSVTYGVACEAVLASHEGWVYSVRWRGGGEATTPQLLTASMDKCLILWQPDDSAAGVWTETARFGEVGGQSVGYYGACFSPDGLSILGHSYFGALHMWTFVKSSQSWIPAVVSGGHFASVEDIVWDPSGNYLLSCSLDQTTRLYAPWIKNDTTMGYYELARPQVHGHDMQCLAAVSSCCFVSGAEEKIFRAFSVPKSFVQNFASVSAQDRADVVDQIFPAAHVLSSVGATAVPSLGLSNKALVGDQPEQEGGFGDSLGYPTPATDPYNVDRLTEPPTETYLMQNTLWPEVHKLYGHGYEVFAIACNHAGSLVATACKASKLEFAAILLWDTAEWQLRGRLEAHNLTVTQLAFSPDDRLLLSVSRDRTWALFTNDSLYKWRKLVQSDKKNGVHSRIVWGAAWSHDSRYFFTVSRDKKVVAWKVEPTSLAVSPVGEPITLEDSVTAVDCAPGVSTERYLLVAGLESGCIVILHWTFDNGFVIERQLGCNTAHSGPVKRVRFRPVYGEWTTRTIATTDKRDTRTLLLASCGGDNAVKVYKLSS